MSIARTQECPESYPTTEERFEQHVCALGTRSFRYSCATFEQIRRVALEQFLAIPRGGLEIGGVLFGRVELDLVTVSAHRPLAIEYLTGPSFTLSSTDEAALERLISSAADDPSLNGLEPVGWYHTHTRSGLALTDEDRLIHARFFASPGTVAVVIKPYKLDPAQTAVYAANDEGNLGSEPAVTFALAAPGSTAIVSAPVVQAVEVGTSGPPADPAEEIDQLQVRQDRRPTRFVRWATIAATLVAVAALGGIVLERQPSSQPEFTLDLAGTDHNITIAWSTSGVALHSTKSAELLIFDGQKGSQVPLLIDDLHRGSLTYVRSSPNVEVRLRVHSTDGRFQERVARFLAPEVPVEQKVVAPVPASSPAVPSTQPQITVQVPPPAPQQPARRLQAPPVKPTPARNAVLFALDTPPGPVTALPRAADVLPAPVPSALPPPPAPAPEIQPQRTRRTSGRAIWSGRLDRDAVLLLDGWRPSAGVLNGPMPTSRARIRIFPADLTESGIVVYADREGIERPSAANGWNLTTYRPDPRRVRDVTVLEAPSAANNWNRLMVRGNRAMSMLVIEWQE